MWIEKNGHGGDLLTAAENFNIAQSMMLDFSANINPLGPPQRVLQVLKNGLKDIIHYPDPTQRLFRQKLASKLGISEDWILAGNGAAECMSIVIQGLNPNSIGLIYPCFSEYEQLALAYEKTIYSCYGLEENSYKPDMGELLGLIERSDLIFLGHPNNPTGITYSLGELLKVADYSKAKGTYIIMDEAFIDFIESREKDTLVPYLEQYPNVIVLRSMTKMFAIPGLRLGYILANPEIIYKVKKKQVTWSVNQLALLAGEACLDEDDYVKTTITEIMNERTFLIDKLKSMRLTVLPGRANFLLVRLPTEIKATELQYNLGKKGVLIRSCAMYRGLTDNYFRIAVRRREENIKLLNAVEQELKRWGESL